MSSNPIPITEDRTPFVPVSTPNIERANRLMGVRAHPGFLDILGIIQDLAEKNAEICADYPGWDPQVIVVLKVRMQAAKELKDAIFSKIHETIEAGVAEAREQIAAANIPVKSAEESLDQGDLVRQQVLESFSEMDTRVPGSYDPSPAPTSYDWK